MAVCVFERLGLVGGEGSTLEKHSINYHSLSAIVCLFCVYLRVFVCVCMYLCVFVCVCMYLYYAHCKSEESGVGIHEWQRHEPPNVSPDIR